MPNIVNNNAESLGKPMEAVHTDLLDAHVKEIARQAGATDSRSVFDDAAKERIRMMVAAAD